MDFGYERLEAPLHPFLPLQRTFNIPKVIRVCRDPAAESGNTAYQHVWRLYIPRLRLITCVPASDGPLLATRASLPSWLADPPASRRQETARARPALRLIPPDGLLVQSAVHAIRAPWSDTTHGGGGSKGGDGKGHRFVPVSSKSNTENQSFVSCAVGNCFISFPIIPQYIY